MPLHATIVITTQHNEPLSKLGAPCELLGFSNKLGLDSSFFDIVIFLISNLCNTTTMMTITKKLQL
jgi:hypothetical protein